MSFAVASDFGAICVGGPSGQSFNVTGSAAMAAFARAQSAARQRGMAFIFDSPGGWIGSYPGDCTFSSSIRTASAAPFPDGRTTGCRPSPLLLPSCHVFLSSVLQTFNSFERCEGFPPGAHGEDREEKALQIDSDRPSSHCSLRPRRSLRLNPSALVELSHGRDSLTVEIRVSSVFHPWLKILCLISVAA